jgi:hypothetical protein
MILETVILNISPALTWSLFVLIFTFFGLFVSYILYKRSKEPIEWKHNNSSSIKDDKNILKKFAESIRYQTLEYDYDTSLEEIIQTMFFKKIESVKGISAEELSEVKETNPEALRNLIKDDKIYYWILKSERNKVKTSFFNKKKINERDGYLEDIKLIIDRMEAWA